MHKSHVDTSGNASSYPYAYLCSNLNPAANDIMSHIAYHVLTDSNMASTSNYSPDEGSLKPMLMELFDLELSSQVIERDLGVLIEHLAMQREAELPPHVLNIITPRLLAGDNFWVREQSNIISSALMKEQEDLSVRITKVPWSTSHFNRIREAATKQFLFKNRQRLNNTEPTPGISTHPTVRCALEKLQNFLAISPHPENRNLLPTSTTNTCPPSDTTPLNAAQRDKNGPEHTSANLLSRYQEGLPGPVPPISNTSEPPSRITSISPDTNIGTHQPNETTLDSQGALHDISGMEDDLTESQFITVDEIGLDDDNEDHTAEPTPTTAQGNHSADNHPDGSTNAQQHTDPKQINCQPTQMSPNTHAAPSTHATSPDGTQEDTLHRTGTHDSPFLDIANPPTDNTNINGEPTTDVQQINSEKTTVKANKRQENGAKASTSTHKSTDGSVQNTSINTSNLQEAATGTDTTEGDTTSNTQVNNPPPPMRSRKRKASADATSPTQPDRSYITQLLQTAIVNRTPPRPQRDPRQTRSYRTRHRPNHTSTSATGQESETTTTKHIPVKGEESILSNFALTPIQTINNRFASAEHMYQHMKARFFRQPHLAKRILQQPRAIQAKTAAYTLMHPPRHKLSTQTQRLINKWDSIRLAIIYKVMRIKFENVPEAADALKTTLPAILYHPVGDHFWGTGTTDRSRTSTPNGKDHFANLLMMIRADLTGTPPPDITHPTSSLVATHQRHITDLLPQHQQNDDISDITDLIEPTEQTTQPRHPTSIPYQSITHNLTPVTLDRKGTLHLQLEDTPTIILSDSQLRQVTGAQHDKPAALLIFPGAKYESIQALLSTQSPQRMVKEVIVAVGINNRDQNPHHTSLKHFTRMIRSCKIAFPNATIYIPEIAHHPVQQETSHITDLQMAILAWLSNNSSHLSQRVSWLKLPNAHLAFKGDGIHLTTSSATTITNHWLSQIRHSQN